TQIELHDRFTSPFACIRDIAGYGESSSRGGSLRRHTHIAISEGRVAETVTEGIQGATNLPAVASLRAGMRREIERNLPDRFRKRDRKPAARVVIAEQHVGERGAARLA